MSFTPPEFHLEHLLRRCFSVAELRSLLTYLPDQGDLKDHLPVLEGITPAAYARQAVRALVARSLVNRLLFEWIANARPERAAEGWAVAALFGFDDPLAGTLSPLPEEYSQYADAHAELRTFVGRVEQLEQLREVLLPRSGPVRAAVVCNLRGMAGVGKTFLVERFFMEHREHFPGGHLKITLGIHDAPTGDGLLRDLAERLGVQLTGEGRLEDRVRAASLAFRALLHLDNVDSQAQARGAAELVARLPGVFLVVTGRFVFDERVTGWRLVPVDPFNEADALAQLRLELTDDNNARIGDDDRRALVTALHGLPLAIRLAASYLNAGYRVEDFLSELKSAGLSLPHLTANTSAHLDRTQWALIATFDISLTALRAMLGAEAEEGMRGVAALGVAPLAGIGRDLLNTIVGDEPVRVIRWVSRAVKLSIVRFVAVRERWRVHKLLSERLRLLDPEETPRALGRLDGWMLARLPGKPEETRGKRWGELQAEHEGVGEWVTGLEGDRAVEGSRVGFDYASVSGPYAAWLGAAARGLKSTANATAQLALLWYQGELAWHAGDLDLTLRAAEAQSAHAAAHGRDREVALAAGLRADVLQARGQLDEALRIRWEEQIPVYERLGDVHQKAVTMGYIADVLQARGQLEEALRIRWEEQIPVYERLGDVRAKAVTMGKIAYIYQTRGQLDEALRVFKEEQIPVFERLGNVHQKAIAMSRIADVLQARGQLDEAVKIRWEEEIPVFERLGDVQNKAATMSKIADVLQARGQLDEALRIFREEVLPVFERLGDVRGKAITMSKIATVLQARGQLDEALRISREEVLPVHERLGDVRGKAVTMSDIADVLQAQGQLDEALRIRWQEMIPVFERLGDVRSKAVTMGKIADVLQARGQLDEALALRWEEEIPVYERLGDVRSKAVTMGQIAGVLQAQGQLDEALRIFKEELIPVFERLKDVHQKAVTMGYIADVLQARGQLDEALRIRREEQIPVYERLGDVHQKAITMSRIADVLQARGQLDEALRIRREEELPVYERLGDVREKAVTLGKIADVLQARGQLDEALRIRREEVLPVYERLGDVRSKAITMSKIADVHQARGQPDEALKVRWEEEIPLYERLGDVRAKAVTMGQIANVLQAHGQLDEALHIWQEEVLPAFQRLGERRELCVGRTHLALLLLRRGHPNDLLEARTLLLSAEAAAAEMNLLSELEVIRSWFPPAGLPN